MWDYLSQALQNYVVQPIKRVAVASAQVAARVMRPRLQTVAQILSDQRQVIAINLALSAGLTLELLMGCFLAALALSPSMIAFITGLFAVNSAHYLLNSDSSMSVDKQSPVTEAAPKPTTQEINDRRLVMANAELEVSLNHGTLELLGVTASVYRQLDVKAKNTLIADIFKCTIAERAFITKITIKELELLIEPMDRDSVLCRKLVGLKASKEAFEQSDLKQSLTLVSLNQLLSRLLIIGNDSYLEVKNLSISLRGQLESLDQVCQEGLKKDVTQLLRLMSPVDCDVLVEGFNLHCLDSHAIGNHIVQMKPKVLESCADYQLKLPYRVVAMLLKNNLTAEDIARQLDSLLKNQSNFTADHWITAFSQILEMKQLYNAWGDLGIKPNVIIEDADWQKIAVLRFGPEHSGGLRLVEHVHVFVARNATMLVSPS